MRLKFLAAVVAVAGVLGLVADREARADGCFVWHGNADLKEPNQRAIIAWDGKTETLLLAVKYEGPAEDFAWVVPLPAKPEVKAIDADKNPFAEISRFTQERQKYGIEHSRGVQVPDKVEVLDRKVVGVYDIAILAAKDPAALADWLKKNGYAFPDKGKDVLEHYTKKEWVYAAMRIDPKQLGSAEAGKLKTGELQPVRFTFASKEMVYPLKISSVNAGQTEVLLYLVADAPMVLASGPSAAGMEPEAIVPREFEYNDYVDPKYLTPCTVGSKELPLTWEALGLAKDAPRHLCKYVATYKSEEMKDDLAFKPFEPLPFFKAQLEKIPAGNYRRHAPTQALALLAQGDADLAASLATNEDVTVRETLANFSRTPAAVLNLLASDPNDNIRINVATCRDRADATPLSQATLEKMARDKLDLVRACAAQRTQSAELQKTLAADPEARVRHALIQNPNANADILRVLAADKDPAIRVDAVGVLKWPEDLVAKLAEDKDPMVRGKVAGSDQTIADVLARLAADADPSVRLAVAKNLKTPAAAAEKMVTDENLDVRRGLALRKDLSQAALDTLAADSPDKYERQRAGQKKQPEDVMRRLAHDPDVRVRQLVAANPFASEAVLRLLAQDSNPDVCGFVALNANVPADLIITLSRASDAKTRLWVACCLKMPVEVMAALAKDADPNPRRCVANNPTATPEILAGLAHDPEAAVRKHVAENPHTPVEALNELARDADKNVASEAKDNLQKRGVAAKT